MAMIEFLGGEETGDVARVKWGRFVFEINRPVECDDAHIVKKARANRFFKVEGAAPVDAPVVKLDPLAKARAVRAANAAARRAAAEPAGAA